jgi:hypothetical protein
MLFYWKKFFSLGPVLDGWNLHTTGNDNLGSVTRLRLLGSAADPTGVVQANRVGMAQGLGRHRMQQAG